LATDRRAVTMPQWEVVFAHQSPAFPPNPPVSASPRKSSGLGDSSLRWPGAGRVFGSSGPLDRPVV